MEYEDIIDGLNALISSLNAQVASLQDQVSQLVAALQPPEPDSLEQQITNLNETINQISAQRDQFEFERNDLAGKLSALNAGIDAAQESVA